MAGGEPATIAARSLQFTPSWTVAILCFILISLSLCFEHLIDLLSKWLKQRRLGSLFEAVEKLKIVLMLLGFMSLLLNVTQRPVSKICVSTAVGYTMLPCRKTVDPMETKSVEHIQGRRLGEAAETVDYSGGCRASEGKVSLISEVGMNQLNNFIFGLAVMQIVYSVLTMALGRAKMRKWKAWEEETQTLEYRVANDPNRFRFTRETTFGRRHVGFFTTSSILLWIKCFCRQFFRSVAKVDYLTLRHSFIYAHFSTNTSFNFQKYIQRSLDDDFKVVVGISPFMWFIVVIFILLDVHGWNVYLWLSFLPILIVLSLGTKLEVIVARLALRLQDQNAVIVGAPLVQPNDDLFWFSHPRFVLILLHFTLFMNAFEFTFFIWVTLQYGIQSCYHERKDIIAIRVVLAVTVQVLCSYITLPLYALVTQMGSQFKTAPLEEGTVETLKKWHAGQKNRRRPSSDEQVGDPSPSGTSSADQQSSQTETTTKTTAPSSSNYNGSSFADKIGYPPPRPHQTEITEDLRSVSSGDGTDLYPVPAEFRQISLK